MYITVSCRASRNQQETFQNLYHFINTEEYISALQRNAYIVDPYMKKALLFSSDCYLPYRHLPPRIFIFTEPTMSTSI